MACSHHDSDIALQILSCKCQNGCWKWSWKNVNIHPGTAHDFCSLLGEIFRSVSRIAANDNLRHAALFHVMRNTCSCSTNNCAIHAGWARANRPTKACSSKLEKTVEELPQRCFIFRIEQLFKLGCSFWVWIICNPSLNFSF